MSEASDTFPLWAFAAFPLFWIMICQFLAILGGWRTLSEAYPLEGDFVGAKKFMASGSFKLFWIMPVNYNNVLTVGGDMRGVYFNILFLFRPGHARIFIPYEDLRGEEKRFLFFSYAKLQALKSPEVTIILGKGLVVWLEQQSGGAWSFERRPNQAA